DALELFQCNLARQFRRTEWFSFSFNEPNEQADQRQSNQARQKNEPGRNERVIDRRRDLVKLLLGEKDRHSALAKSDAALSEFEERTQCRQIIFARPERDRVDVATPESSRELAPLFFGQIG